MKWNTLQGIHPEEFVGYVLLFIQHAVEIFKAIGYAGSILIDVSLSSMLETPWLISRLGSPIFARSGSELDDDISFSIMTSTDPLIQRPDGVAIDIIRQVFFSVNWPAPVALGFMPSAPIADVSVPISCLPYEMIRCACCGIASFSVECFLENEREHRKEAGELRILIADDHETVRRGIIGLLSRRPGLHIFAEAVDGIDAVEKAKEFFPDVVLMDISMPRMDGLEATRIIRRELPESAVIIVTQNDPTVARQQGASVDALGFVSKSKLAEDLLPEIERISTSRDKALSISVNENTPVPSERRLFSGPSHMAALMRAMD